MGCCRGPTRFEFVRQTDETRRAYCLLTQKKEKKKKKNLYCNTRFFFWVSDESFRPSSRSRFFPFVFIGFYFYFYFYPYHVISYHIISPILHYSLFFSFIPTSAFVFSYLMIPSPSLRHMGPGVLMTCSMSRPTYLSYPSPGPCFICLFYSALSLYFSQFRFSH